MGGAVKDIASKSELDNLRQSGAPVVLHFWASWCDASKQMDQVFSHLATDFPRAHFFRVEAEEHPEISEAYSVSAVPYFVFFKDGKAVDTLEGADPSSLANKVGKVAGSSTSNEPAAPASLGLAAGPTILETVKENAKATSKDRSQPVSTSTTKEALNTRLEKLTKSNPVMLFMKGTPEEPRCGFSKNVVNILKEEKVEFGSFDILSDNEVREGLKKFSNWPTYPQLYSNGELLGGADIVIAMHESGELKEALTDEAGKGGGGMSSGSTGGLSETLQARLEGLVNSSPVMLFMKGKPEEPKCGFSGKVVEILKQEKIEFASFDILLDDEVRQGLKVYSNWSSYPQLYVKGELLGGSDIVLEMQKSGELKQVFSEKGKSLEERLKSLINSEKVMLFMKGSPDEPKDEDVSFGSFDILSDEEVRQGIKSFSNWPTFPQLYYKGELVGGCDIIMELSSSGDLKATLSE
ncbi:hypothetical protein Bca52824_088967 [Brassica carinata]|uniref:Thioredoxin domain-containing protein n=1 Tax=Brassica carinata TaxID=52824 RepID=A0A8X7PGS1_BRACI|nr:hypothetical protein Bca52824_088967 [Brassica carinata]